MPMRWVVLAASLLIPASAWAQSEPAVSGTGTGTVSGTETTQTTTTIASPTTAAPPAAPTFAPEPPDPEIDHHTRKPFALSFGVQGGLDYFTESGPFGTDTGVGLGLAPGYNLGLRASFEFLPWLALDARGLLLKNDGNALLNYGSLTGTGGFGAARFTLPTHHIRPYALIGFGGYHFSASGANTQLVDGTFSAIEMGLGATVPTGRNFEVGVEWLYNHLNSETLSTHTDQGADGGDPSTLSIFVQYRLPI